jgi:hypothetical protein
MAKLADSERVIWSLREQNKRLLAEYLGTQQILAVLLRRAAGVTVIEPVELMEMPADAMIVGSKEPDGCIIVRLVTGEPGQPGRAG